MKLETLNVLTFAVLWVSPKFEPSTASNITVIQIQLNSSSDICSYKKSLQQCLCLYKKDSSSVFPILYADCTRMHLTQIPDLADIEDLDVSHNSIKTLDPIKANFSSQKIRTLRISYNRLHFVYQDFFKDLPNLVELDLSNNELVKFSNALAFSGITELQVLDLSSNRISTLPDDIFENLPNLKELDLSYNYLGSLFSNTNNLFNSPLKLNSNITTLKLEGLGISNITLDFFNGANYLTHLSMANNPLQTIPNVPNTLTYLDISGTDLVQIRSGELPLPSLKILKLNRSVRLETIEDYAFCNLTMLEQLYLNECKKLKQFNVMSFGTHETVCPIKRLHMSKSGLRTISSNFLKIFETMDYVDVQNNPWTCDCKILWLRGVNNTRFQRNNLRCATPSTLLNKNVMDLADSDVSNCFDSSNYYQTIVISLLCCIAAVLFALILYLFYLGPFYYKNRYKNIGPQSPYNGNTLSDIPIQDS